jgi:hypothetical protein
MPEPHTLLLHEFLKWVASRRRTYAEAMDAWRSSCPRHSVWEDALVDGLIHLECDDPRHPPEVVLTSRGRAVLNPCPPCEPTPKAPDAGPGGSDAFHAD